MCDFRTSVSILENTILLTATIHKWVPLLENDFNKQIIADSLKYLSDKKLITVFAFVIMPNHIHLIWQQNDLNGKETPKGSLLKYSAHLFLKQLKANGNSIYYEVNEANKNMKYGREIL